MSTQFFKIVTYERVVAYKWVRSCKPAHNVRRNRKVSGRQRWMYTMNCLQVKLALFWLVLRGRYKVRRRKSGGRCGWTVEVLTCNVAKRQSVCVTGDLVFKRLGPLIRLEADKSHQIRTRYNEGEFIWSEINYSPGQDSTSIHFHSDIHIELLREGLMKPQPRSLITCGQLILQHISHRESPDIKGYWNSGGTLVNDTYSSKFFVDDKNKQFCRGCWVWTLKLSVNGDWWHVANFETQVFWTLKYYLRPSPVT